MIDKAQTYVEQALSLGAARAAVFCRADLHFEERTLLKCKFGCGTWGRYHTCPSAPLSPSLEQYQRLLSRYSWGLFVGGRERETAQKIAFRLEQIAFHDGYYLAFSLSGCARCPEGCTLSQGQPCRLPQRVRPELCGVGLDLFRTLHGLGLPLNVLDSPEAQPQNWYSAVFVE